MNILFVEEVDLRSPQTGDPEFAYSGASTTHPNTWVVKLNTIANNFGTQEFWAATILHEIIHGFIRSTEIDFSANVTPTQAHLQMIESWVENSQEMLIELFQMDEEDAMALSLQGVDDVLKQNGTGPLLTDLQDYL